MIFLKFSLLCVLFCVASSEEVPNHQLPRLLIMEYTENPSITKMPIESDDHLRLRCTSWRFAAETGNLNPWKTTPLECNEYVRDYMTGLGYDLDLERACSEAGIYARSVETGADGKDVWIFDVDETLLSNLPYYQQHGYGLEVFDNVEFDKWVDEAIAPPIMPSLNLYKEVMGLGFKIFLLTGRNEKQRNATENNLIIAGFQNWDKLILRNASDDGKPAVVYKSEKRMEMVQIGLRILGNLGDQWSDLLGTTMSTRSFKLPNPLYYIQ